MTSRKERNVLHLFLFLVLASTLGWFINSYPPEGLGQFASFYLLFGLSSFFFFQFTLCHTRRALLLAAGLVTLLILRSLNLRHPLYITLLFACLIAIEYPFTKKKIR